MRRSLGGLLLLIAAGLFAVSIGAFWLERVAFSPSADTDSAFEILRDEDIRKQIATLVATIDGPVLGMSPVLLSETIEGLTERRAMATEMRRFIAEAHGRVIGDHDDQVVITAAEQVQIVRNEGVALQDPIVLPVEEVGSLSLLSSITRWLWLIGGPLAIVLTLFGLAIRPERGEFSLAFSLGCAATGLMLLVMGYVVPAAFLPALSDDVWVGVFPRLAANDLTFTFVGAVMFVAVGALAMFGTSGLRQRRQRSTPLASARYREQQRWSGR